MTISIGVLQVKRIACVKKNKKLISLLTGFYCVAGFHKLKIVFGLNQPLIINYTIQDSSSVVLKVQVSRVWGLFTSPRQVHHQKCKCVFVSNFFPSKFYLYNWNRKWGSETYELKLSALWDHQGAPHVDTDNRWANVQNCVLQYLISVHLRKKIRLDIHTAFYVTVAEFVLS